MGLIRIAKGKLMNFMIQEDLCIDDLTTLTVELRLFDPEVEDLAAAKALRAAMTDDKGRKKYVPCELFLDIGGEDA